MTRTALPVRAGPVPAALVALMLTLMPVPYLYAADTIDALSGETLTLRDCVDLALGRHPDIGIAVASAESARASARQQSADLYPQLIADYSWRESRALDGRATVGNRTTTRGGGIGMTYTIFETGRRARIDAAKVRATASEIGIEDTRRLLAYEVITAYYDVLATREYTEVAMRGVIDAERHRELVQAKITAGTAPESDLLPINLELANARLDAVRAEADVRTAEAGLRAYLVLPPAATLNLVDPGPVGGEDRELGALLDEATRSRPDLAERRLRLDASRLSLRATEAAAGVSLSASATADWGHYDDNTGHEWSLRAGASYPLYDAGASSASVQQARADHRGAELGLQALEISIQQQVESAYYTLVAARESVDRSAVARADAQQNLAAAEARYAADLAIILEVTDAQTSLRSAEVSEIQAQYNHATALAALRRAVGGYPMPAGDQQ